MYIQNSYAANKKLNFDYGLRLSAYSLMGGTYNIFDNAGNSIENISLAKNDFGKKYVHLEPRLAFSYNLNETTIIKTAYSRNVQNLHLLSNSTSTNPTDQWIGSSYNIKPELADQVALGYFKNFVHNEKKYDLQIEAYYKTMQNQVDYKKCC